MGSSDYMALLLRQVSAHKFHSNPISSEYMGPQSTWVVRVHAASEYMLRLNTWVMTVHGPSDYMALQLRHVSAQYLLRQTTWVMTGKFHSNPISSEYMDHHSTWVVRVHGT